jgi:acetylornithine deacetylase/succinyl-diaminopimelate desuccinylase-like protein
VRADERPPDAAIVYDGGIPDADTPAITVGLRGVVMLHLEVRTAQRNLHSGMYGGSVLNALHVMQRILAEVLPGPDGRVRAELRAGILEPSEAELESWRRLPPGAQLIAAAGGFPITPQAGDEYYRRNGADASVDLNEISGGEPRTIVSPLARATLSMRLAPGQDPDAMYDTLVGLLRGALPEGAQLDISSHRAPPALFEPEQPALQLAAQALKAATGLETAFVRTGGSVPIVAEMAKRGYPVIVGGFGLPEDSIHAPDESYALRSLEWGEASARELYSALAALPAPS